MSKQVPLASLARDGASCKQDCDDPCDTKETHHGSYEHHGYGGYFAWGVLWFIIIAVIVWLILLATNPTWVQKTDENGHPTGEVDQGKACLWAVVIAFIIIIIIWILKALAGWSSNSSY